MPSTVLFDLTVMRAGAFAGGGFFAGTTRVNDASAARQVVFLSRPERVPVASVWATGGTFIVHGLNPQIEFDVISRDWNRQWQDLIVGAVKPKPYE